jgi:hypothetical protein
MCKDSHFYPHNQIFEAKKYSYIQVFKYDRKVFEKEKTAEYRNEE